MKRAVLLTGHFPRQKRRGSILWVSDALQAMGWHVTLATVGYSWLSRLVGDRRLKTLGYRPVVGEHVLSPRLTALFGLSPVHPLSLRSRKLDQAAAPLMKMFVSHWDPLLRGPLNDADLVIVESGAPILLAPLLRHAPQAQRIYRINDDVRLLRLPEYVAEAEQIHAPHFTRISSASPRLAGRIAHPNVTIDPMGIPHDRLRDLPPDPYTPRARFEAVCAGTTQIDLCRILDLARARPEWRLHVIGRLRDPVPEPPANVVLHGERAFDDMLGYVAHADIGLAPYLPQPGVEYQTTNSNRILLYRHFGLPILGPDRLCHPSVPSVIGYSEPDALLRCERWRRRPERIPDWSELARRLAGQNALTDPPVWANTLPETA